ncbi:trafficking protein particle complex subunit 2-like protein isoform X1 [Jatropha curcas]|uniref:trafficking protein particle complex subunit 2-like protein isoform X1 n=1 Tax=Jatropha curcas TaxID=180498 RepID=UPI001893DBE0|nr:trafficking protein particle complex subunit 2-like protein isoform X1 [Jatropha curcas]
MIVCVAVVGHQNNPLYIQSFTEADDALKLHHIVHCSLDVVDERVNNPKKSGPTLNETFLGLLYPTENYKVYGYLTNTKVKFILVTTDLDVRDADVRNVRINVLISCRTLVRILHRMIFPEVPCRICRCSFKPISRAGQKDHFQNFCRKGEQHCQIIWLELN